MVDRTSVQCEIGYADGEVESYVMENSTFKVVLRAWNGATIEFLFDDAIRVLDNGVGEISDVCCESSQSDFLVGALTHEYDTLPREHPYKQYSFLDIDDCPALIVVASGIEIRYESAPPAV